jgi:hypothetical protein
MGTFLLLLSLSFYYSTTRPHSANPELGWTVELNWTHPTSYGTPQEQSRLITIFWCAFMSVVPIALGEAIRIYVLERTP